MRNTKTIQSLKLVVQGRDTVMVAAGEVPVLYVDTSSGFYGQETQRWMRVLIMAMNFLRSGSPEVAIYSEYLHLLERGKDVEGFNSLEKDLRLWLRSFGDGKYIFRVDIRHGRGVLHLTREELEEMD